MSAITTAILRFNSETNRINEKKQLRHGLSVAVQVGNTLWVTNDETISLERLTFKGRDREGNYIFDDHQQFLLQDYITLPAPPPEDSTGKEKFEEADLEGIAYSDGYLWLVGSHSLKRGKAKLKATTAENLQNLSTVSSDGNRFILARIPVTQENGMLTLKDKTTVNGVKRRAAQIKGNTEGSDLTKLLKKDEALKAYFKIPGKDNGFDIEGLAVADQSIFLGLRGPVLRGWAVLLQLEIKEGTKKEKSRLRINKIRKHFLQLNGLGIRDLVVQGSDLLFLAGPTMDLDGPVTVYRWRGGVHAEKETFVFRNDLEVVLQVPFGSGDDHAEGMTLFSADGGEPDSLLIVYDSACQTRLCGDTGVKADIFPLKNNSSADA